MAGMGIYVVRQAGSAGGLVPLANKLASAGQAVRIIAFPQAWATCRELAEGLAPDAVLQFENEAEARAAFAGLLAGAAFVMTGTSAEAENDAWFWRSAREHGVPVSAYLDQWANIGLRFPGNTTNDWPDRLCVIDEHDAGLARAIAPAGVAIDVAGSPALENMRRQVAALRAQGVQAEPGRVLFASEPMADQAAYRRENGCNDEDSFVLACALLLFYHPQSTLVLRLHPRDSRARWEPLLPPNLKIEWDADTRAVSLARAARVFGMRSFFLLEALAAGVPVTSLQPGRTTTCPLTDGRMPVVQRAADYSPQAAAAA